MQRAKQSEVAKISSSIGKETTGSSRKGKGGPPRGSRNAAKPGEDLKFEMYFSKMRRGLFEEWFELRFGRKPSENELRQLARNLANNAINSLMAEDFERMQPGRISDSKGEVF